MIPVNTPKIGEKERINILECIDTNWISSEGPFVKMFENNFSNYIGHKYGVAVCNGSAALDIAIKALELPENSEIIVPTFTIISPVSSIVTNKHTPVLVDSHPNNWNMDVDQIESKITKKTKAILVVHIYGLPVKMDRIIELANKYDLKIIEDAAEMHGQEYNGKKCGSFGDVSIFSFYPNKHITTGEGGMVLTSNSDYFEKCKSYRNLCFKPEQRFVHEEIGWNYRMTNMQAALGVAQLEQIDSFIERKREIGLKYLSGLKNIKYFEFPEHQTNYAKNIYWVFGIMVKQDSPIKAKEICFKLSKKEIGTRPFFWCMHEQPVFKKMGLFKNESYPVAENMARNGFYIPSGLGLTDGNIDEVINNIKSIFNEF